jgi:TonB family protein
MKTYLPIGMALLVAGLLVPEALGQHAQADLDRMPIFGMPAGKVDRNGAIGNVQMPDSRYLGIETRNNAATQPPYGVEVTRVDAGSPASQAGFKAGDIVLDFNGHAVESTAQLARLVNQTDAGHHVQIGVWRSGTRLRLAPTVDAIVGHPDSWPTLLSKVDPEPTPQAQQAGIEVTVPVYAVIGADGRVCHARLVEGSGYGLNVKALEAVAQWRFDPARKNGVAVMTSVTIQVHVRPRP